MEKPEEKDKDKMTKEELYIHRCSKCPSRTCTDRKVSQEVKPDKENEKSE